jgi:hypothetical protein
LQTDTPLEQSMVALVAHGLLEVQAASCVQAAQVDGVGGDVELGLQTPTVDPDVHAVPGVLNVWSLQTGAPLVQSVVAVASQTLLEVHAAPCVHALHTPVAPLHTPATPPEVQAVPASWNVRSVQTGAPVPQSMVAVRSQGFDDVQVAPAVQEMHDPAPLQTPVMVPDVHPMPAATND